MTTYFYLHGWLSSPQSTKAQFLKQCLEQSGLKLHIPDFNQNDFFNLTLTRQIQQVQALLPDSPVTIMGASFGGLTALWLAERLPQVQRLVLLAPALNFVELCKTAIGETQYALWREQGQLSFYHYSEQGDLPISYAFMQDLQQYVDSNLQRRIPTLIMHGNEDEIIPLSTSREFKASRPWVELVELDSDHQLNDMQAQIWQTIQTFGINDC